MKSRLGIGKYPDTEVGRLLKVEPNAIRFAYYHFETIDFVDEVKEAAGIKIMIEKPGVDHEKYIENSRLLVSEMPDMERLKYISSVTRRRKIERSNRHSSEGVGTHMSKRYLQAVNHGKASYK